MHLQKERILPNCIACAVKTRSLSLVSFFLLLFEFEQLK